MWFVDMKLRYLIALVLLPITRYELPGWGRIVKPLGLLSYHSDDKWTGLPVHVIRGKIHGFKMQLDLANWSQRMTWFLGRFYELDTQMAMMSLLNKGDTFVDIGANIGMLTLVAARQIGETGKIYAFELNPVAYKRLLNVVELNNIRNVEALQLGLSDTRCRYLLSVVGTHDGAGSLSTPSADEIVLVSQQFDITTITGDEVLEANILDQRTLVKIDVEGHEVKVLKGLSRTILKHRPIILMEFEPAHLRRAGSSEKELVELMQEFGYSPYAIVIKRSPIRYRCRFAKVDPKNIKSRNIAWFPSA